jgi:hypothetical protein
MKRASPDPRHAADLGSRLRSPRRRHPGTGVMIAVGGFVGDRTADGIIAAQGHLVDLMAGEIATKSDVGSEQAGHSGAARLLSRRAP